MDVGVARADLTADGKQLASDLNIQLYKEISARNNTI
jgi:hypothetical protein